jgi:hypothetical protein
MSASWVLPSATLATGVYHSAYDPTEIGQVFQRW